MISILFLFYFLLNYSNLTLINLELCIQMNWRSNARGAREEEENLESRKRDADRMSWQMVSYYKLSGKRDEEDQDDQDTVEVEDMNYSSHLYLVVVEECT